MPHRRLAALLASGWATIMSAQDTIVVEVPDLDIDDVRPMGLTDIASVFPFAGPFAPTDDGAPGDSFLHESLAGIPRGFLEQLLPVLQARWPSTEHPCGKDVQQMCPHADAPLHCLGRNSGRLSDACLQEVRHTVPYICSDQIRQFCEDNLEQGILPCLEAQGSNIGPDCADAIIAARHALSSLSAVQRKASNAMNQAKQQHSRAATPPRGASLCPAGWEGPRTGGCCTRRWSPACGATCSSVQCNEEQGWEFKWADFRTRPYICCPKVVDRGASYVGGQPLCPSGWYAEQHAMGPCCRRAWSWACGQHCAQEQCSKNTGLEWIAVNARVEHYRCCPARRTASSTLASVKPGSGLSIGSVQEQVIGKTVDPLTAFGGDPLSANGWTTGILATGSIALVVLVLRQWLSIHSQSAKEQ